MYGRKVFANLMQNPPMDSTEFMQHTSLLSSFLFRPAKGVVDYKNQVLLYPLLLTPPSPVLEHFLLKDKRKQAALERRRIREVRHASNCCTTKGQLCVCPCAHVCVFFLSVFSFSKGV